MRRTTTAVAAVFLAVAGQGLGAQTHTQVVAELSPSPPTPLILSSSPPSARDAALRVTIKKERAVHVQFRMHARVLLKREEERTGASHTPFPNRLFRSNNAKTHPASRTLSRQLFVERVIRHREHQEFGARYHFLHSQPTDLYYVYRTQGTVALITVAANMYGVSPSLMVAIARCESGLRPWAANPSGAAGLFQFMSNWGSYSQRTDPVWSALRAARAIRDGGTGPWASSGGCW